MNTERDSVKKSKWQGKIWFDPESGDYWRAGIDGQWIAVNERSIERHLRVNYGLAIRKVGISFSEVEEALDQIQMTYVLEKVKYVRGDVSDELEKHLNNVITTNGRNILLLSLQAGRTQP
jgi:hypothetical protein